MQLRIKKEVAYYIIHKN